MANNRKKKQVKKIIRDSIKKINESLPLEYAILFGSHAGGQPHQFSDIDLAIISKKLEKQNILKKIELLAQLSSQIDPQIEIQGWGYQDFLKAAPGSFLNYLKKKGKIVFKNGKFLI